VANQRRITKTKIVLSEIKGIKFMGLETKIHNLLQNERVQETIELQKFNWIMVWVNVVGMSVMSSPLSRTRGQVANV
jgi:hypothetical protein